MQAVKAGNHEKCSAKLRGAKRVTPGADTFIDNEFGPLKGLHAHKAGTENNGKQQHQGGFAPVATVGKIHRHGHGAAAGDQHKGHDGDQYQRQVVAEEGECEHFTGIGPGLHRRHAHSHVGGEKTTEDKGIAEQENPHHGLAPGHAEYLLVR